MSLHSSLKIDKAGAAQRTVQTRIDRIKELMKKGLWKQDSEVFGLPKTKIIRIKAKKKAKAEEGVVAPGAPAEGAAAAAPAQEAKTGAKTAALAKGGSALGTKPATAGKPATGAAKK